MTGITPEMLFARISDDDVLRLTQDLIQRPSPSFSEGVLADFLAEHMTSLGMQVDIMEVPHPFESGRVTRQPVGVLKGLGGGRSLMFTGHMDPGVEMSGWTVDHYVADY